MRANIDPLSLAELRFRLRGELYEPGTAEYEDACTLFNSTARRRPALVARCTATEDVVAALAFAREQGIEVMVDQRGMRDVEVDADRRIARVGAGADWAEVDRATRQHGFVCGSLLAATLVTPEGEIVRVTADGNPELLWTLRGVGDDSSVVVSLELRLRHSSEDEDG